MPRRPRPSSRRPPVNEQAGLGKPRVVVAHTLKPASQLFIKGSSKGHLDNGSSNSSDSQNSDEEGEEELDVDAPRIAQWVDEEELDMVHDGSTSEDNEDEASDTAEMFNRAVDMSSLQDGLSSLPFGTLRKAQKALSQVEAADSSEDDGPSSDDAEPETIPVRPTAQRHDREKEREDIQKRKNKHAPMEVTSKKPVPRKKLEFEEKKVIPRDPRFIPLAGEFSASKFQSQYGFLKDMHQTEISTLRENLKRARKLLTNSPRDLREEREAEVSKLERAVKRAESTVNKDRREKIEHEALEKVSREEHAKRKEGKGAWYMKNSDKKELLVRAKYDALAASGGKSAVRKAMEKKQRKVNQKEKKQRPFAAGSNSGEFEGQRKRSWIGDSASRPPKRLRVG